MRIAFLTRIQRRINGDTIHHEPLGGTQSAMIYLARALAARGHEPHIFCNGPGGVFDGVSYHPVPELARFARAQPLDVFVSIADELALKLGIPARITLWWSHNDYSFLWDEMPDLRAEFAGLLATKADRLVAVSNWHAAKLAEVFRLDPAHLWVGRNGVHWPYFAPEPAPAQAPRLLYTSVPDRGLDRLLALFPRIRQRVPGAELHIYSSFSVWGKDAAWDQQHAGALYALARETEGVSLHAPLPHARLAEALRQGWLLAYPSHATSPDTTSFWAETSCIAALEAQAAGLPVVSSARGALPETVLDGETGLLIPGDPMSEAYGEAFVEACVNLLSDRARRDQMALRARARIQAESSWELIAAEWEALLGESFVSTRSGLAPLSSAFPKPQISVIIPTYNRARNLHYCLDALTRQDIRAFEVIVCDDGSSDHSREVAESFKDRLNLRYRWQEDLGFRAAEARNLGLRTARGKLIVFLDSDIVAPPDFLRAHAAAHEAHGTQKIVVNSFVWRLLEPDDRDLGLPPAEYIPLHQDNLKPDSRTRYNAFERGEPLEETYFLDSNAFSIKREDIELVGGFDGSFVGWGHEDTELGYRLADHGFRLVLIQAQSYHLHHEVADTKEEERAVNWKRLALKHGISRWYRPLWELPVEGLAVCQDRIDGLPVLMQSGWVLRTGQPASAGGHFHRIVIEDGIVTAIENLGLAQPPASE